MSDSDAKRGVTVRWVDRDGHDHVFKYPSAVAIEPAADGALWVYRAGDEVAAIHAPGRWDNGVVHPEPEKAEDSQAVDVEWKNFPTLPTGAEVEASLRELQATLDRLPEIWASIPRSFPSVNTGAIQRSLERFYAQVKNR